MTSTIASLWSRATSSSTIPTSKTPKEGFTTAAKEADLFTPTNPQDDGEDCLHDCATCTIKYPAKFSIDEKEKLYGQIKGWSTHLIVGTGKTDWVRDVADEKGSIMEAVERSGPTPTNGRLMLSASNMPLPDHCDIDNPTHESPSTVLLLPAFTLIENVTPTLVPDLITHFVNPGPTNNSPLSSARHISTLPPDSPLKARPCPHDYLVLLCSQKTRDARCGQSAPLLRREFERHLRPLGLYRDLHDERPGGVGIYFISHVGGHKFSANVLVYRSARIEDGSIETGLEKLEIGDARNGSAETNGTNGTNGEQTANGTANGEATNGTTEPQEPIREAGQCIWLARIKPEDCENIVKYTILQGKVVKPKSQLRGGFDRCKQLTSW